MEISLIAAIGANNEIGKDNKLLWSTKEDMNWFKKHTVGKVVVMGRATYESIGRPLDKRVNVVLSRDKNYNPHKDVVVMGSVEQVLANMKREREVMIIGGEEIYKQFFPYATRLYLTEIDKEFEADSFFPEFDKEEWISFFSQKGTGEGAEYSFKVYRKKPKH